MHYQHLIETVSRLFIAADQRDWQAVKNVFTDTVLLDYSSMGAGEPANLPSGQIIDSWKGLLPGFESTHHQLGNFLVQSGEDYAEVFCYATATHYLPNESNNDIWTVVGSYNFELRSANGSWRISKMKFNLKYIDGNTDLPKLAQEKLSR